ncbi:MAG: hypothetical protein AAF799_30890 [Myxococcota bacterium]
MTSSRWRRLLPWVGGLAFACTTESGSTSSSGSSSETGSTSAPTPGTDAGTTGGSTGPGPGDTTAVATSDSGTSTDAADTGSTTATTSGATTEGSSGESTGDDGGLGVIEGQCGLIDAMELESSSPFTFEGSIDFRELGFDYDELTPGGQEVFDAGNLGGSSLHSEVIAYEVLARCEGASLLATEGEVQYLDDMGTKTDLLVEIDGLTVGVSVTRAIGFPFEDPYTVEQANELLLGKFEDVVASTANVAPRHEWVKQILHVIAYSDMHAASIATAYAAMPAETVGDTVLVVTVTHGDDAFIY